MEDRCVCCGEIIPEGRMVCVNCEKRGEELANKAVKNEPSFAETSKCKEKTGYVAQFNNKYAKF